MSALLGEELVPLSQATKWVPARRGAARTHPSTLFRWATEGLHGVRLEVLQVGGSRCTSREALHRFFKRLTEMTAPTGAEGTNA